MTTSRKGKAAVRDTPSKSTSKRKGIEDEDDEPIVPRSRRKQRRFSDELEEQPQTVKTPTKKQTKQREEQQCTKAKDNPAFAGMYNFTSSKPKTNGFIDLTNSPSPDKRKPSFSAQRTTFNPHQGPKKLVVKNLRMTPRIDPQQYLEKVWQQENAALDSIFKSEKEPYSLEELYKGSENVCRQGKAAELYIRVRDKCSEHLSSTVRRRIENDAQGTSNVETLRTFIQAWLTWKKQLVTMRQIFYYMDQAYLLRSQEKPSVTETGLLLYRLKVFEDSTVRETVLEGVVDLVDMDRRGQISEPDSSLLRESVDTLHELGIYSSDFEPHFETSSEKYFRSWREVDAKKDDLSQYATRCTQLLGNEMKRCDLLSLDRSTRSMLSGLFDTILVEEEVDLLTSEAPVLGLFDQDKANELEQTWTLLQRRGHGEKLGPIFDKYTVDQGSFIVFDEKHEADMVTNLLDFKRRLDNFLNFSFHKNQAMGNGLHKSFEHFINKTTKSQANWETDNAKPGEMIAKHIDLLLKGGVKAVPKLATQKSSSTKRDDEHDFDDAPADEDAEINLHLSNALDLFRFVHGKAVFEAFYKKDLARRLLMGRSASFDAERSMLTRLKNECGPSFTHNLESMFKDMDLAREEMMSYKQLMDDRGIKSSGPDLSVNVLSASAWPTYPDTPVKIPQNIISVISSFEKHYKSKHSGRKLTWKHALAHCQLRARFPKGNKELVVSGFQAIVLLLFNNVPDTEALTYTHLKSETSLSDAELCRTLQSLACAKYRVLAKHPKGRDIAPTDTFTFDSTFTDPKMRIKINQIQLKETRQENKETHERVAADRHYETQAAIVRIMKSRKTVGHNELIIEVINATKSRGVLGQADIRRNIEKYVVFFPLSSLP
jgi:Cullin family/Cullin protein neddylation domain